MNKNDVIYFSVNNWFCGRDYPDTKNFRKWMENDLNQNFRNDDWCKKNKLCVYYGCVDMSQNYTVSASREWVEKNCPELLSDKEYTYTTEMSDYKDGKMGWKTVEHKMKYSDFVYVPEEGEELPDNDRIGDMPFREYREENFGSEYYETGYWDSSDDEDDDEYYDEEEEQGDEKQ